MSAQPPIDPELLAAAFLRRIGAEIYRRPLGRVAAAGFLAYRSREPDEPLGTTIERAARLLLQPQPESPDAPASEKENDDGT